MSAPNGRMLSLLDDFEHGRIPLLEFMRSVKELRKGSPDEGTEGVAITACFGHHSEGRDLMACILEAYGFKVIPADRDSSMDKLAEMCLDPSVDVLCISAQTTYDCPDLYRISDILKELGVRDRIVLNIGGAPVTEAMAEEMGCDVFSRNAVESVRMIESEILRRKERLRRRQILSSETMVYSVAYFFLNSVDSIGGAIIVVSTDIITTTVYSSTGRTPARRPMDAIMIPTSPLGIIPTPMMLNDILSTVLSPSLAPRPHPTYLVTMASSMTTATRTIMDVSVSENMST